MNPAILDLLNYYWSDILSIINFVAAVLLGKQVLTIKKGL